jgi:hypothetical protein
MYPQHVVIILIIGEDHSSEMSSKNVSAWFSAAVDARMSTSHRKGPYRMTGVLVRRDGRWLWQLHHGGEPR